MLTQAWVNNSSVRGGQIMNVKESMANNLCIKQPKEMSEIHLVRNTDTGKMGMKSRFNRIGKMTLWLNITLDKALWNWHIKN